VTKPDRLLFQIVNPNVDYLEFVVSYYIGEDHWVVDGIGWLKKAKPTYYLRLLRLNGVPVAKQSFKKALLVEKHSSFKFANNALDTLILNNIHQLLSKTKN
jgi:hypothetical protein